MKTPILIQTQLKRRIVSGRDKEVQMPIVDIAGGSFLQPETEGETRLGISFGEVCAPCQPMFVILKFVLGRGLQQNRSVWIDTLIQECVCDLLVKFPGKRCPSWKSSAALRAIKWISFSAVTTSATL